MNFRMHEYIYTKIGYKLFPQSSQSSFIQIQLNDVIQLEREVQCRRGVFVSWRFSWSIVFCDTLLKRDVKISRLISEVMQDVFKRTNSLSGHCGNKRRLPPKPDYLTDGGRVTWCNVTETQWFCLGTIRKSHMDESKSLFNAQSAYKEHLSYYIN